MKAKLLTLFLLFLFAFNLYAPSLYLEWGNDDPQDIDCYYLTYLVPDSGFEATERVDGTNYTARNLQEGKTYIFFIEARYLDGSSSEKTKLLKYTVPAPLPKIHKPRIVLKMHKLIVDEK